MAILSTAEILNLIHKETGRFPAFPFPCHWKLNIPYTEDELTEKKRFYPTLAFLSYSTIFQTLMFNITMKAARSSL